jgi:eukaryotic-like serine/threonine-protein kinase
MRSTLSPLSPGTFGRYELLAPIGAGGMGTVYAARVLGPAGFQKRVAIKRIHAHLAVQREFVQMFIDEARIVARLEHPNIAHVFELGEHGGDSYIAMEYLHGEHLGALCTRLGAPLAPSLAAHIIALAAAGLHHAHEATDETGAPLGVVHRDVSPQNIFVTYDGHVKLTDFGIARAEGRLARTHSGRMKGKTGYVAPEQVVGERLDRRADIFSLGVVLFEITTATRLFAADSDAESLFRIANHEVRDPREHVADYPEALASIVAKSLGRFPSERFQTAAAMARALDEFRAGASVQRSTDELADLMRELFLEERVARDRVFSSAVPMETSIRLHRTSPAPRFFGRRRALLVTVGIAASAVLGAGVLYAGWAPADDGAATDPRAPVASRSVASSEAASTRTPPQPEPDTTARQASPPVVVPIDEPGADAEKVPGPLPTPRRAERRPEATIVEPARLNLLTRPWASVSINGREVGTTPLVGYRVDPGRLNIVLRAHGEGEPHRLTIDARSGERIDRSLRLDP